MLGSDVVACDADKLAAWQSVNADANQTGASELVSWMDKYIMAYLATVDLDHWQRQPYFDADDHEFKLHVEKASGAFWFWKLPMDR